MTDIAGYAKFGPMFTLNFLKNTSVVFVIFIILLSSFFGCNWPRRKTPVEVLPPPSSLTRDSMYFITSKPRVLIFSSIGGGGHMSASYAIRSYLGETYEVQIVNIIAEAVGSFDILRFISGNTVGGEDLYNFFLRHGLTRTVGIYCSLGHIFTSLCSNYLDARVGEFLDQAKPDIIISVMPFFNGVIYRTSQERHIPFFVVACDLNTINYVQDMYNVQSSLFRYGVPFHDANILKAIEHVHIPSENIKILGFPVREPFFVQYDKDLLRTEFNFPADVPIVMILMGAVGGRSVLGYLRKLVKMKTNMHIVVCVGRNEGLKRSIEAIVLPSHISVSVFGYTDKIAQLMQSADVLITKPGPTSICEALYARVPLLLDSTSKPIFWESMNVDFVVQHRFGEAITSLRHVPVQVKKMLEDAAYRASYIQAMEDFAMVDPRVTIPALVEELLQRARQESYGVVSVGSATA